MITRNEILERHNLSRDKVAVLSRDELTGWEKVNPELAQCTHALCSQSYVDHWDRWGAKFNIAAFYPDPGVYLVKRITQSHDAGKACDRCQAVVSDSQWDYISCMCKECSEDRSRWKCRECGDNLGLINDLKNGRRWYGFVEYCNNCLVPPEQASAFEQRVHLEP